MELWADPKLKEAGREEVKGKETMALSTQGLRGVNKVGKERRHRNGSSVERRERKMEMRSRAVKGECAQQRLLQR